MPNSADAAFSGSIPQIYEQYLVPMLFQPYAHDVATRVAALHPERVLEVAAGTGVVTRAMSAVLPPSAAIVATDLNQAMVDEAARVGTSRPIQWRQADVMQLPFGDGAFDVVVCQFGVMFFPDRPKAFAEVRRVLKPGGTFVFNVWDETATNDVADAITNALAARFPVDTPSFLTRTPYAYHNFARITRDLHAGGFANVPRFDTVTTRTRSPSARAAAIAFCQGTPLRNEIEAHGSLEDTTSAVAASIARRFGDGEVDAQIRAHIVSVVR